MLHSSRLLSFAFALGVLMSTAERSTAQTVAATTEGTKSQPALLALLWMQHSAEYRALCRQTFNTARALLETARQDPTWTASLEQSELDSVENMPSAVIVDIDETVLDNSAYTARLIAASTEHTDSAFTAWAEERQAGPVPGAVEFLNFASQHGVRVFYVTNRQHQLEASTRDNLTQLGFPLRDDTETDVVLMQDEQPGWTSDKRTRRASIALTHRILMLFGDDLGDFLAAVKPELDKRVHTTASVREEGERLALERALRTDDFAAYWGTRWFMLPNPCYGSWLRTLDAQTLREVDAAGGDRSKRSEPTKALRVREVRREADK